jgi:arylsulfatase A-like enzyme
MAETLCLNGYSTAQLGKCHEVPVRDTSPMGPFDMWPTGSGFEYIYGFIGGEDNQWDRALTRAPPRLSRKQRRGGLPPDRGSRRQGDRLGCASKRR